MRVRTALVTGASSGIGMALARRMALEGVEVALVARREKLLRDLCDEISKGGGKARIFTLDVADPEATVATLQRADDEMQGIDVVVANAGIGNAKWGGGLSWDDCREVISVNVRGAVATLTALLRRMVDRKRGHLVGISSLAQYRGLPNNAVYGASKAFLSTFLESLRIDLSSTGVSVTDVRPGFVQTPMTDQQDFDRPFLMQPDEAAEVIVRGIEKRDPVVEFPWQLAALARSSRLLTRSVYDRAVVRALKRKARKVRS
jgi:short-subunit dehydrogenase